MKNMLMLKNLIKINLLIAGASALLFVEACYNYPAAQVASEEDTFSQAKKDHYNKLLQDTTVLTLQHAQQVAVNNNPSYSAVYHSMNASKMRYYQALGAYSPVVTGNAGVSIGSGVFTHDQKNSTYNTASGGVGIRATWLLFDGMSRTMNMLAERHQYKATKALLEDSRRLLVQAVAFVYYDVLLSIERQKIAKSNMDFQLIYLAHTQMKFDAGAVPLSEVLNFKVEVNLATSSQIQAEYNYVNYTYSLARLMGHPEGKLPDNISFPTLSSDTDDTLTAMEVYLDTALNNRPDLRRYRELLRSSQYTMYSSMGSYLPTISAYGSAGFVKSHTNLTVTDGSVGYNGGEFEGGLQAEWLLFNGLTRLNRVRETQALVAAAKFNVAEAWLQVVDDVRTAYINYILYTKQSKIYKKTLGLVTKQRDLVAAEYRAGNTELARLFQAQNVLIDSQLRLVISLVSLRKAKVALDAATNSNTIGVDLKIKDAEESEPLPMDPLKDIPVSIAIQ